ncbi:MULTISPECIES: hypothetical protein [Streptomyces]
MSKKSTPGDGTHGKGSKGGFAGDAARGALRVAGDAVRGLMALRQR